MVQCSGPAGIRATTSAALPGAVISRIRRRPPPRRRPKFSGRSMCSERLLPDDAAVPNEVRKQPYPVLGPAKSGMQRLRHAPWNPHPVSRLQVAKWSPAGERQERMIRGGLYLSAGCQSQLETSLVPVSKTLTTGAAPSAADRQATRPACPPPVFHQLANETGAPVSARNSVVSAVTQPDSRRSESIGFLSCRCSGPRLSWESATTGT